MREEEEFTTLETQKEPSSPEEYFKNLKTERITLQDLAQENHQIQQVLNQVIAQYPKQTARSSRSSKSINSALRPLKLDKSLVVKKTLGNYASYTIPVIPKDPASKEIENVILEQAPTHQAAYLISYHQDDPNPQTLKILSYEPSNDVEPTNETGEDELCVTIYDDGGCNCHETRVKTFCRTRLGPGPITVDPIIKHSQVRRGRGGGGGGSGGGRGDNEPHYSFTEWYNLSVMSGSIKWTCTGTDPRTGECNQRKRARLIPTEILKPHRSLEESLLDDLKQELSNEGQYWLENHIEEEETITNFLLHNSFSKEAKAFAKEVVEGLAKGKFETSEIVDIEGIEPIKPLAGTIDEFKKLLDSSPNKVGLYKEEKAEKYLIELSKTEFSYKQMRPIPTQTGYFNRKKGRYIYTKKGGWIDMVHFLFYASKAYNYKKRKIKNPIGEAIQDGYKQEFTDSFVSSHSAYSYEDLPSDKYGAIFGVNYFNPKSDKTFSEQLKNYFDNILKATIANNAPNYNDLPKNDPSKHPSKVNYTTTPIFIKE